MKHGNTITSFTEDILYDKWECARSFMLDGV